MKKVHAERYRDRHVRMKGCVSIQKITFGKQRNKKNLSIFFITLQGNWIFLSHYYNKSVPIVQNLVYRFQLNFMMHHRLEILLVSA